VRSLLLSRQATAQAVLGNAHAADRAMDQSAQLLADSDQADLPPVLYWFGPYQLELDTGWVHLATNRFESAETHLRRGVDAMGSNLIPTRVVWLNRLATVLATNGQVDQACAAADEAAQLARDVGAPARLRRLLTDTRAALRPFDTSQPVRTFDAAHHDLLTTT
jgi:hypothetical protein